eukprot:13871403-Alexandrium_andersonii.AAC.1
MICRITDCWIMDSRVGHCCAPHISQNSSTLDLAPLARSPIISSLPSDSSRVERIERVPWLSPKQVLWL